MYQSLEIFCQKGKNYFFNLYKKQHCENAFKILSAIHGNLTPKDKFELINENTTKEVKKVIDDAKDGAINNYDYLLKLNDLSSRTFNDPNQYPIFPWLFFNLSKIEEILSFDKNYIEQYDIIVKLPKQSRNNKKKINNNSERQLIDNFENSKYKKKEINN